MKEPERWDDDVLLANAQPYLTEIVTVQDAQALGYCVLGQRRLWRSMQGADQQINGVTFEDFIRRGVTVEWLLSTGHPYAGTLVTYVVRRLQNGQ